MYYMASFNLQWVFMSLLDRISHHYCTGVVSVGRHRWIGSTYLQLCGSCGCKDIIGCLAVRPFGRHQGGRIQKSTFNVSH